MRTVIKLAPQPARNKLTEAISSGWLSLPIGVPPIKCLLNYNAAAPALPLT
jgi:hypothetical protein